MTYKKFSIVISIFALFLLALLSSCNQQESSDGQPNPSQPSLTMNVNDDGSCSIFQEGVKVGGSDWLSYPNAEQVDFDAYFDTQNQNANREPVKQLLRALWILRLGEDAETPDYSSSNSDIADLEVDFITTTGDNPDSETDYLFTSTDRFYVIWFQDGILSSDAERKMIDNILSKLQL